MSFQMRKGCNGGQTRHRLFSDDAERLHPHPVAECAILYHHLRPNQTARTDMRPPEEMGLRRNHGIAPNSNLGINHRRGWILNGHPGQHMPFTQAPAEYRF